MNAAVTPAWKFTVAVDGDDLVVENTTATWFGGADDPLDDGETASGVSTRKNLLILGCALPVIPGVRATADSPFSQGRTGLQPAIPWQTLVVVMQEEISLTVALIDNGPARSAGDGIDLTQEAFRRLGGDLRDGVMRVSYRVIGAAKFSP